MRKLWLIGALVMLGTVAVATLAHAQTTSAGPYYATPSWDQQLPASTRFIVLSNWNSDAVLDRETGLVWEKSPQTTSAVWDIARFFCANKNVGGRKGWRLPSINELASLIDPSVASPALPAGHPFTNVASSFYWSASTNAQDPSLAWFVLLSDGLVNRLGDKTSSGVFVWCVRGGGPLDNY